MIINSHVHISYIDKKKEFSEIKNDLLLDMEKNKVDLSIVIPDNLHESNCADLETVNKLIENEPKLLAIGTLKVEEINKKNVDMIGQLLNKKDIRGFKIFPGHDPVYPIDQKWKPIYDLCVKYNAPLIIHTGIDSNDTDCAKYNDPKHIVELAKEYPELKIVIAHYFWPKLDYCFDVTNGFDNIYFDTSGLADAEVIQASGGIEKIRNILNKTVKRNSDSVIFGTDWPMCETNKHINLVNSLSITEAEKEKIFYKNCLAIFGSDIKKAISF